MADFVETDTKSDSEIVHPVRSDSMELDTGVTDKQLRAITFRTNIPFGLFAKGMGMVDGVSFSIADRRGESASNLGIA